LNLKENPEKVENHYKATTTKRSLDFNWVDKLIRLHVSAFRPTAATRRISLDQ
jgi:hypothetical protein